MAQSATGAGTTQAVPEVTIDVPAKPATTPPRPPNAAAPKPKPAAKVVARPALTKRAALPARPTQTVQPAKVAQSPGAAAEVKPDAPKPVLDPALVSNPGQYIQQKVQPNTLTPENNPTFVTGLFGSARATLLADAGGLRPILGKYGITIAASEVSEVFGNATGGIRRGAAYDGLTTATLQLDTLRAFGLPGGTFQASALQIHGRNLSAENLLVLQTISGIEANRATRLWELWYDQSFANGLFDIKVGQQSLDQEYYVSAGSSLFINTMMGWPLIPSVDQYAGGPAYPLSSLGARLRVQKDHFTALLGVFDDNPPAGPFDNDSQTRGVEASGTRFNTHTGALIYGELQYARNQPSTGDLELVENKGLPGTYKIGFWYDTAKFLDQRFDNTGLSLSDPNSTGIPLQKRGNFSVYGVVDQTIYRPDAYEPRAVSVFIRPMFAPEDRNLISFSVNGGITLKQPFEGRDNDTVGLGFGIGRISNGARGSDFDMVNGINLTNAGTGMANVGGPIRTVETFIEATYQFQVAPWWNIQPDFQYIFRPSGGIVDPSNTDPNNPTKVIRDEAVFGVRTTITF